MEQRPYQLEAKEAVFREWNAGNHKTLLVLPTGAGKTIVFSFVIEYCANRKTLGICWIFLRRIAGKFLKASRFPPTFQNP